MQEIPRGFAVQRLNTEAGLHANLATSLASRALAPPALGVSVDAIAGRGEERPRVGFPDTRALGGPSAPEAASGAAAGLSELPGAGGVAGGEQGKPSFLLVLFLKKYTANNFCQHIDRTVVMILMKKQ